MHNMHRNNCPHFAKCANLSNLDLQSIQCKSKCRDCPDRGPNLWLCLFDNCYRVGCSEQTMDHSTLHNKLYPEHSVHVNLTTKRLWCYSCRQEVYCNNRESVDETNCAKGEVGSVIDGSSTGSEEEEDDLKLTDNLTNTATVTYGNVKNHRLSTAKDHNPTSGTSRAVSRGLVGLQNIGNTCYMNAALQALSNTEALTQFFLDCPQFVQLLSDDDRDRKPNLSKTYCQLLNDIWTNRRTIDDSNDSSKLGYVVPSGILYGIRSVNPIFRGYHQHDTQEFLRNFMDQLHEELKQENGENLCKSEVRNANLEVTFGDLENCEVVYEDGAKSEVMNAKSEVGNAKNAPNCEVMSANSEVRRNSESCEVMADLANCEVMFPQKSEVRNTRKMSKNEVMDDSENCEVRTVNFAKSGIRNVNDSSNPSKSEVRSANVDSFEVNFPNFDSSETEYETCDSGMSEQSSLSDENGENLLKMPKKRFKMTKNTSKNQKQNVKNKSQMSKNIRQSENMNITSLNQSKVSKTDSSQMSNDCQNPPNKTRSIISDIFDGKLLSSVQCLTCNRISSRIETFQDLSLPIPSKKDHFDSYTNLQKSDSSNSRESAYSDIGGMSKIGTAHSENGETSNRTNVNTVHRQTSKAYSATANLSINGETSNVTFNGETSNLTTGDGPLSYSANVNLSHLSLTSLSSTVSSTVSSTTSWIYYIIVNWFKSWFYGPSVTLYDCLAAFFSTDELKGDNMYSCEKCSKLRNGLKYSKVLQLPEVLCIHLKRFRHELMSSSKITSIVNFPLHNLNMTDYIHQECTSKIHNYQLFSLICHYGTAGGGHYVCYAKNTIDSEWYEYDDQCVTKVTEERVRNCEAYVLFYRKQKTDNSHRLGHFGTVDDLSTQHFDSSHSNSTNNTNMEFDCFHEELEDEEEEDEEQLEMANLLTKNKKQLTVPISKQWLSKLNSCAEPPPLDNSDICSYFHYITSKNNCQTTVLNDRCVNSLLKQLTVQVPLDVYTELIRNFGFSQHVPYSSSSSLLSLTAVSGEICQHCQWLSKPTNDSCTNTAMETNDCKETSEYKDSLLEVEGRGEPQEGVAIGQQLDQSQPPHRRKTVDDRRRRKRRSVANVQ